MFYAELVSCAVRLAFGLDCASDTGSTFTSAIFPIETRFAVMHSKALAADDGHLGQNSRQPLPKQKACK